MKELRIFPRKTNATPNDPCAIANRLPTLWDEADKISISVSFEWDIPRAEQLADEWKVVTENISLGGPAYKAHGGDFIAGRFLKPGYTITSRGCPNSCWFCRAWRNEGHEMRLLPIVEGFNVLDNNLLACPDSHINKVFDMLSKQKERPRFTGGFEAKLLKEWHVTRLIELNPQVMWFAYDTPDDYEPLVHASKLMSETKFFRQHIACCYVLIGWANDTIEKAEKRLKDTVKLGFFPQAMLLDRGAKCKGGVKLWRRFAREWANKWIVGSKMKSGQA